MRPIKGQKKCNNCGALFTPYNKAQKYCSQNCYKIFLSLSQKTRLKGRHFGYRECKICGKKYKAKSQNQKYCCFICQRRATIETVNLESPTGRYLRLRFEIFSKDNFRCQYCGREIADNITLVIDHIVPAIKGGKTMRKNLITSCTECNLGKGDILLEERQIKQFENKA